MAVTPSSIPSSATHGLNANLSSNEGFEEGLEDDEDEPIAKNRVSDLDEEDGSEHETEAMGMSLALIRPSLLSDPLYNFLIQCLIILHIHSFSHKYS